MYKNCTCGVASVTNLHFRGLDSAVAVIGLKPIVNFDLQAEIIFLK